MQVSKQKNPNYKFFLRLIRSADKKCVLNNISCHIFSTKISHLRIQWVFCRSIVLWMVILENNPCSCCFWWDQHRITFSYTRFLNKTKNECCCVSMGSIMFVSAPASTVQSHAQTAAWVLPISTMNNAWSFQLTKDL